MCAKILLKVIKKYVDLLKPKSYLGTIQGRAHHTTLLTHFNHISIPPENVRKPKVF